MKTFIKKTLTISIFNEETYTSRQITISKSSLLALAFMVGVVLVGGGYFFVQYDHLRSIKSNPLLLQQQSQAQKERLATYTEQVQFLDQRLDRLRSKMEQLRSLEDNIHQIARIKPAADDDNLFGVGGSKADSTAASTENSNKKTDKAADHLTARKPATHDDSREETISAANHSFILQESDVYINPITSLPASLPVQGAIIKKFEIYESRLTGNQELHKGLSIKTDPMVAVKTPASGIISYCKREGDGTIVMIDHGHGFTTRYTYLTKLSKKAGDKINEGEVIGYLSSNDKQVSEDKQQLNYELFFNGIQVNPQTFISQCPFLL